MLGTMKVVLQKETKKLFNSNSTYCGFYFGIGCSNSRLDVSIKITENINKSMNK